MNEQEIMMRWYQYAARQPSSVEALLQLLRERTGETVEEQRAAFGASEDEWIRLRGFRAPRGEQFSSDAQRIAAACHLGHPFAFVQQLKLARNLMTNSGAAGKGTFYQAAFDAEEDLDQPPEAEEDEV